MEFTLDEKNLQEKSDSVSKMVSLGLIGATGTEASQLPDDSRKPLILFACAFGTLF
jgi:hypothetical protein